MKHYITLIALIFSLLHTYSQNYIGVSRYGVKEALEKEGHYVSEIPMADGTKCLFVSENDSDKAYYFNDQNLCIQYTIWFKEPNITKSDLIDILNTTYGYSSTETWYDGEVKIIILFDTDYYQWKVTFYLP